MVPLLQINSVIVLDVPVEDFWAGLKPRGLNMIRYDMLCCRSYCLLVGRFWASYSPNERTPAGLDIPRNPITMLGAGRFPRTCLSLKIWRSVRRNGLAQVMHPIRFVVIEVEIGLMKCSLTPSRKVDNDDDDLDGDDDTGP